MTYKFESIEKHNEYIKDALLKNKDFKMLSMNPDWKPLSTKEEEREILTWRPCAREQAMAKLLENKAYSVLVIGD